MDCSRRANSYALAAHPAFGKVDIRNIVLDCDSTERTFLCTFAAPDTSIRAGLASNSPFVFVHATNEDAARLRPFLPQLDDVLRTSLDTSSA